MLGCPQEFTNCGDFPGGSVIKNPPCNAGDVGSIAGQATTGGGVRAGRIRAFGPLPALEPGSGTRRASSYALRGLLAGLGLCEPVSGILAPAPGSRSQVRSERLPAFYSRPLLSPEMGGVGWSVWPRCPPVESALQGMRGHDWGSHSPGTER